MQTVLNEKKFEVFSYPRGDGIIKEIKRFFPDIVLLDIKISGISGVEAIQIVKGEKEIRNIPVIAFTSYAMKGDKEKFLNMGFDGYISKPINTRTVEGEIMDVYNNNSKV